MNQKNKEGSIKITNSGETKVHISNIYEKLDERKKEINQTENRLQKQIDALEPRLVKTEGFFREFLGMGKAMIFIVGGVVGWGLKILFDLVKN